MAGYSMGEVEALLGLPASTIRHWEKVVPLLSPRKDSFGRRVFSEADLRILLRLRHLAFDRGLGIGGAGEAILLEAGSSEGDGSGELRARLAELRGELIGLYFAGRESVRPLEDLGHPAGGGRDGKA
jgi:DNA-binding transcriptional MerR regulator